MVGNYDASTTDLGSVFGVGWGHDTLQAEMAVPVPHHLGHIVPAHRWVEHLREIIADRECAAAHIDVLLELRQSEPLVSDVVDSPPRLHCKLQHPSERQPERYGKACAKIAFAVPTRNAVYGQHQNVDPCVLRALQHCPVDASILVEIELINLRRIVCLTQLIETHR